MSDEGEASQVASINKKLKSRLLKYDQTHPEGLKSETSGPHHLRICISQMFCGDFRATYLETSVFEPLPGISADSVATAAHTGFYTDVFTEAMAGNGAGATLQTWFLRKQSLRQELGLSLGGARVGRPD